ncbi:MAG: hypothetical protein LPK19_01765, partial [Hymenobacteraceae bacterium]|nr:hypothetical protein [Hymenobacteraceae bacterium]MDX5394902.1 hypothetical protein [Hymenobacteraceae bacterium]MDX5510937.1 hypothetical protein [Hymenobacteraceae bacterium]
MKKLFLNLALACLPLQAVVAQTEPEPVLVKKEKKVSIVALPALFYTPETSFGFGTMLMPVFRFGSDSLTRTSNLQLLSVYTLEKQLILENRYSLFTNQNRYSISGEVSFYDFPIDYYGVGNNLDEANKESISYNMIFLTNRVLRQVAPSVFLGAQYRFINLYNLKYNENSLLFQRPENERDGGINSGLGYVVVFDNRDNVISAHK